MTEFHFGQSVTIEHRKPWLTRRIRLHGKVWSWADDRLVLHREFSGRGRSYDSLAARQRPGDFGTIEIRRGGWITRRRYFRRNGRWIGDIFNVQTPAEFSRGRVIYVDLEIDVSWEPGPPHRVTIHDAADLRRAEKRGGIPAPLAATARNLAVELACLIPTAGDPKTLDWDWDISPVETPDLPPSW